jgi:TRAP-type C4-dicarboxylate transport system permease small subunit
MFKLLMLIAWGLIMIDAGWNFIHITKTFSFSPVDTLNLFAQYFTMFSFGLVVALYYAFKETTIDTEATRTEFEKALKELIAKAEVNY